MAFSPSSVEKRMSPPERAGITTTTVFGFMCGAKALKYWPCAKEGTAMTIASAWAATLGPLVMSSGLDFTTLSVSYMSS